MYKVLQVANKGYRVFIGAKKMNNTALLRLSRSATFQLVYCIHNRHTGDITVKLNPEPVTPEALKMQRLVLRTTYPEKNYLLRDHMPGHL